MSLMTRGVYIGDNIAIFVNGGWSKEGHDQLFRVYKSHIFTMYWMGSAKSLSKETFIKEYRAYKLNIKLKDIFKD